MSEPPPPHTPARPPPPSPTSTGAVDVWSVGCILAELLLRKPLFAGRDYLDQLALQHAVLGAPAPADVAWVTNDKARAFLARHAHTPRRAWGEVFREARLQPDAPCLSLLEGLLHWSPAVRLTVDQALQHPFLAALHEPADEPCCPRQVVSGRVGGGGGAGAHTLPREIVALT